ncbi:hypothetical protein HGO38_07945 [Rhizobium sp. CG5]|nr:hypothetical protein [Rhizobium sp. CG5]
MAQARYLTCMRYFHLPCLALTLSIVLPLTSASGFWSTAYAQDAAEQASIAPDATSADKPIDSLLTDLRRARDPETAQSIASTIMTAWGDSGSATVNLMMQWANEAIGEKRNAAALDFLDQAIVLDPTFAEAWNRRATLHYTMGSYRKSMADIHHVLALEPRHFGALAGLASILAESGRDEMALKAWERYLDVYPADREAQETVTKLSEKLAGNRT